MIMDYDNDVSRGPHRLVVKGYNETFRSHECEWGGSKRTVFVDLFVNGDFPEDVREDDLIGKTVEVDYTHGFLWLAMGVRVVEQEAAE